MAGIVRRKLRRALLLALVLTTGCSPASFYFFMPENKNDPEVRRLAAEDGKKEVRVVILTYANKLETRPDLLNADRELAQTFAVKLKDACAANEEHVVIVNPRKVEEFKSSHPSWYEADLGDVGKHFRADYVIYLEINKLSLLDKGSANMLYKGQADISVSLVDVNHPEAAPDNKAFVDVYPSEARAIPADDPSMPVAKFRQAFFNDIAKHLSWYFTSHAPREDHMLD